MPVFSLHQSIPVFPHPSLAEENGLLAIGGVISAKWLLSAYQWGIFPWFNPGEEILWWSPNPRFVIHTNQVSVSKSMRPYFNQNKFSVTYNTKFVQVMEACKTIPRPNQDGDESWIDTKMIDAYTELHNMGKAISVEVWDGEQLAGGLYGVRLGKIFFGESMFANVSNASKFGFISLAKKLNQLGCDIIDCQIENPHLKSLGGTYIDGDDFMLRLRNNMFVEDIIID